MIPRDATVGRTRPGGPRIPAPPDKLSPPKPPPPPRHGAAGVGSSLRFWEAVETGAGSLATRLRL